MSRYAARWRREASCSRRAGSPRSHPSVTSRTIAPRPRTRRDQRRLNSCSASPMRVPPDQSDTVRETCASAASGRRSRSCRVMRVRRVPNVNVSTRPHPRAMACDMCRRSRVYASIDPETSQRITSGRRFTRGARRRRTAGSPCVASDLRMVARASRREPFREERKRRLWRSPGDHLRRSRKRAAAARSAAVIAEKSVPRRSSVGLAMTRTLRRTSDEISLGTGAGRPPPRPGDQNRSNVTSNAARSACRETRAVRLAARTSSGRSRPISAIAWRYTRARSALTWTPARRRSRGSMRRSRVTRSAPVTLARGFAPDGELRLRRSRRAQEISDEAANKLRLLERGCMRRSRNDRELTEGQRFVERRGVGERQQVVVPGYHERRRGDLSQIVRGERRLTRPHQLRFLEHRGEVLLAIRRPFAITVLKGLGGQTGGSGRHVPVEVVVRADQNERADEVRTSQRDDQRDIAPVAPADEVRGSADELLAGGDRLGGHVVVVEWTLAVCGAAVAAAVERDDAKALAE